MFARSPFRLNLTNLVEEKQQSTFDMDHQVTSLFNSHGENTETAKMQTSGTRSMTIMSKIFALEKSFFEELKKLKEEAQATDQQNAQSAQRYEGQDGGQGRAFHENSDQDGEKGAKQAGQAWNFSSMGNDIIINSSDQWKPLGVRNMRELSNAPLSLQPLPLENMKGFTLDFLMNLFGGAEWSPGVFYPASEAKLHSRQLKHMIKSKTYYCMDANVEPFLPKEPGEHGAKLTVFFREDDTDEENMHENVPLFVSMPGSQSSTGAKLYTYFGHYSQTRWSDRLDYDTMEERVPQYVKEYWVDKLVGQNRPNWLEEAVMEHFWPKPKYEGVMPDAMNPEDGLENESIKENLRNYILDLADWQRDTKVKFRLLKKQNVIEAFSKPDAGEEPGLRFWWEYLQCVGFDRNFYYLLANSDSFDKVPGGETNGANGGAI